MLKIGDKVRQRLSYTSTVGTIVDKFRRDGDTWAKVRWPNAWTPEYRLSELRPASPCNPGALDAMSAALDAKPARHGATWTIEEHDKLVRAVRRHDKLPAILARHERTEAGIHAQLERLAAAEHKARFPEGCWLPEKPLAMLMGYMQLQASGYTNRAVRAVWGKTAGDAKHEAKRPYAGQTYTAHINVPNPWLRDYQRAAIDAMRYGSSAGNRTATEAKMQPLQQEKNQLTEKGLQAAMEDLFKAAAIAAPDLIYVNPKVWEQAYKFWGTEKVSTKQEEKPTMEKFYIVVRVEAGVKPATKEQAIEIANTKARQNPDSTFYIMESIKAVSLVQPEVACTDMKDAPKPRAKRKAATKRKAKR